MGQALWAYNGLVRGERTPSPSPVDLGYLAIIPLLFAGLVTLVGGAPRGAGRLKVVLDAVIAMASIATLSWFAVLGPLYVLADNTVLAKVFSLFLPAGDVLYLFAAQAGQEARPAGSDRALRPRPSGGAAGGRRRLTARASRSRSVCQRLPASTMEAVTGPAPAARARRDSVRRRTTHALVMDELRGMILSGELKPGERLRIDDLAGALGVSPMPVREALHQLAAEGTTTLDPFRGFSIAVLSAAEAVDIYSTRAALEALAARIAVPLLETGGLGRLREALDRQAGAAAAGDSVAFIRWDLAFHRELYTASRRPVLTRQVLSLINSSVRYSRVTLPLPGGMDAALAAHRAILAACERGDAAGAAESTRLHTEQAAARVIGLLEGGDGARRTAPP